MSVLIPPSLTRAEPSRRAAKQATRPRLWTDLVAFARAWKFGLISLRDHSVMQLFVMVGTQRTGTNLLREVLATNAAVNVRGEIFSPGPDHKAEWERHLEAHGLARPADYPQAEAQWLGYLAELRRSLPATVTAFGLDVKYSQLRTITPYFEPLCSVPMLVAFFRASGCRIVHVVRENVLQAALSEAVAAHRRIWHHDNQRRIDEPVPIDCRDLIRIMQEKRLDRQIFASLMEGHGRLITCEYERTVRGLAMTDAEGWLAGDDNPLFELADFLGVARRFRPPPALHKVVQAPYREILANYDAVVKTVRRTEFAAYLDTI